MRDVFPLAPLRPPGRLTRRSGRTAATFLLVALAWFYVTTARAGDGPAYATAHSRPTEKQDPLAVCSFSAPLCVHAPAGADAAVLLATLADLERADRVLVRTLGLPRPVPDGSLGGGPSFDVYLADDLSAPWVSERDDPPLVGRDRASSFGLIDRRVAEGGARTPAAAALFGAAIAWGIDAAEGETLRTAIAAYLADLVAPCSPATLERIDDFQAHPERALTAQPDAPARAASEPGQAMLFPSFLDAHLGAGAPGSLPIALLALSARQTPLGRMSWTNEPDFFDALRGATKSRGLLASAQDLLVDFAVARAFLGDRDDGTHFPEAACAGTFGRVRFDWSVPFASLPRRLAPAAPIDPTGATYLWVDLAGAPPGARLAFRAEWEPPVLFHWTIVRVAADGREASRVRVIAEDHSTSAERNVEGLDGLAGLVIVGVNDGRTDLDRPFDPDDVPYLPHGYVVTLAPQ